MITPDCLPGRSDLPLVSFVIPVRDDAHRLERCLASIRENLYPADLLEIVVADNGSRDGSSRVAAEAGAIVLDLPRKSVAQLRNLAAAASKGEILAFVDADHVIDAAWVASAVETLADPRVGATGAPYLPPPNPTWVQRAYDRFRSHDPGRREVEWLGSGNLAVRRSVFESLGGFDTSLETCEDVDLCNRIRAHEHRLLSDGRLRSVHSGDPATLRGLFFGELWRGRDNIRVTLHGPLTMRALPSVVIPVLTLLLLVLAAGSALALPWVGVWPMATAITGVLAFIGLRTLRMALRSRSCRIRDIGENAAVAAVYELGRAVSLVVRATHRTRREGGGA